MKKDTICLVLRHIATQTHLLKALQYTNDHNSSSSSTSLFLAGNSVVVISGRDWAFFYPSQRRFMADAERPSKTPRGAPLKRGSDDHIFELFALANRLKHPSKTTRFALILRIPGTIRTIFHDVLRTAFATNFNFVNHGKNNLKAKLWNHRQNDTTHFLSPLSFYLFKRNTN